VKQLGLFARSESHGGVVVEIDVTDEERAIAARLPRWIRFGTSSWTFPRWPMWRGTPTAEALARSGLRAYASHPLLRTVGIDRSYYGPLRAEDLEAYAVGLPEGFVAVSKVWDELTTAVFPAHPRYGARAGTVNPAFLDADRFVTEVLAPYRDANGAFAQHVGPFVFELTPMPRGALDARTLSARVEALLERLPAGPGCAYAFELRNEELFGPRWIDTLRAHGAAHVFTYWTAMPSIRAQLAVPGAVRSAPFVVARLMLPRYARYAAKKAEYAPFDALVEIQPEMRDDVMLLLRAAAEAGADDAFVVVNNKAEGSAPLTIRALADRAARELTSP
jgi:uncharacterized protein YecE (DUF72 family)